MEMKFYRCARCGQIIAIVKKTGVPVICCGEPMQEIIPGTTDAAVEKHVPVYEVKDSKVFVTAGTVEHPMLGEHYIEWVSIQTKFGNQRKALKPGMEPRVCFSLCEGDEVVGSDLTLLYFSLDIYSFMFHYLLSYSYLSAD